MGVLDSDPLEPLIVRLHQPEHLYSFLVHHKSQMHRNDGLSYLPYLPKFGFIRYTNHGLRRSSLSASQVGFLPPLFKVRPSS